MADPGKTQAETQAGNKPEQKQEHSTSDSAATSTASKAERAPAKGASPPPYRFVPEPDLNDVRVSFSGRITLHYKDLVDTFGPPSKADGCKISGIWVWVDDKGAAYTVYDYKQTDLYDSTLPSVATFRTEHQPHTWHIGAPAYGNVSAFQDWLQEQI
jgi:hypothetical protein